MVSAYLHFQNTWNRLFNNCIKLYWYNFKDLRRKGGGVQIDKYLQEKSTFKKPSLNKVKSPFFISAPNYHKKRFDWCLKYGKLGQEDQRHHKKKDKTLLPKK